MTPRHILHSLLIFLLTLAVGAVVGEGLLRLKNRSQQNYTMEMWRYARELKQADPELGHVHQRGKSAQLQNVEISINALGMRGPELRPDTKRRVLLLGSSITLGWGVPEEQTTRGQLEKLLPPGTQALNGAVGNYTAPRYVRLLERDLLEAVKPDVVVVDYFIDDAKAPEEPGGNWLMRHSQLGVTLFYVVNKLLHGSMGMGSLTDHYAAIYDEKSEPFRAMVTAMDRLDGLSRAHHFKVVLAVIPDVHQLTNYPFTAVHEKMAEIAKARGWVFVDFLEQLQGFKGPELWTIPGDPHPNAVAHKLMAERLAKAIGE